MEPDNRIWYAVWNMELKNVPGTIVGDFCFKGLGKDGAVSYTHLTLPTTSRV